MFENIITCGILDKKVTSLDKELGFSPNMQEVKDKIAKHFAELFHCDLRI